LSSTFVASRLDYIVTAFQYEFLPQVKVKLSVFLTKHHTMETSLLLNEAPRHEDVLGSGGIASRPESFTPWVRAPGTY